MSKKVIAVALILIMAVALLTSCNLFTLNDERDANQVLATMEYKGLTATVTKGEFINYFNQNAPIYVQYYQWTVLDCVEAFMTSLAKREILLMEARLKFAADKGVDAANTKIMDLLDKDEQAWVVNRANKVYSNYVDAELKNIIADNRVDVDDDEDALEARKQKAEEDLYSEYKKDAITEIPVKYLDDFDANISQKTANEKKAVENVKKQLEKVRLNYDYFLEQQTESRLLNKFKEDRQSTIEISDKEIVDKYNLILNQQKIKNITDTAYKTALDGSDTLVYHKGQYVKVKSILLKFTAQQDAVLKAIKSQFPGDDNASIVEQYRYNLVFGNNDGNNTFPFAVDNKYIGLRVNISNPDYDPDAECKDKNCKCTACVNNTEIENKEYKTCKIDREQVDENGFLIPVDGCTCAACINNAYTKYNVPFLEVLDMINAAVYQAGETAKAEYNTKYPDGNDLGKQMYVIEKRIEAFEDQIYLFNDDSGMFEDKDYIGTPDGKASDYVTEYTALIRALMNNSDGAGSMATTLDSYNVSGTNVDIYDRTTAVDNNGATANVKMSYIINDYGVHIVMITSYPVDTKINQPENIIKTDVKIDGVNETFYTLGLDAIIGFDSDKGIALTVRDKIKKDLLDTKKSTEYNIWERDFFKDLYGDDLFDKANKESIKVDDGVYKQILKQTGADKVEK